MHLTRGRTSRTRIVAFAKSLKSLCTQGISGNIVIVPNTPPIGSILLLTNRYSGLNELHIVIARNYFRLVCNLKTVLLEVMKFAMVKVDIFCKSELIPVWLKLFDWINAGNFSSESKR